jgi:competence protein ComEA
MSPINIMHTPRVLAASVLLSMAICAGANAGPVNVNTADAATIASELKGIGLKRAQTIIDYRAKHGPFKSADELALIKGIGPKVIQKNRVDIKLDGAKTVQPAAAKQPVATPAKR